MNICCCCGEPCEVVTIDFGVGYTDAWGVPNVDVQIDTVSQCCETEYEDNALNKEDL